MLERSLYQRFPLVRRVTVIIDEIAAHPTNFAQLLISVAIEDFEVGGINESVIISVDLVFRIWMQSRTARHRLEYRLNYEITLINPEDDPTTEDATYELPRVLGRF